MDTCHAILRYFDWDGQVHLDKGKTGGQQHADGWDTSSKAWAHMVLHLPHTEGGFGVTFNDVTKDAVFHTTTSRFVAWLGVFSHERQGLWLPKDDLQDSSSWSSSPLLILRDIHSKLLSDYNCKEVCVSPQSKAHIRASDTLSSQCITLCTKLSFCFGGFITLFQLFYTPCKFASYHHTRETPKRACLCTLVSLRLPRSLSLVIQSFLSLSFVFYSISALSYLLRARTSVPRRCPVTLLYYFGWWCPRRSRFFRSTQQSGVTSHYSVDSQSHCPCPAL
jgi:hypothetical protein